MSLGGESCRVSDRWSTSRLEAFSDGVFAIAITLLILEINVPESGFEDLWKGIADQWPSYLAYATSFITIGGLWLAHHGIFRRLASADGTVMQLNILLLMLVSFLPFPTKLMAEAIDKTTDAERVAVIFYGLALLAISVVVSALWRCAAAHRDLLAPGVSAEEVKAITQLTTPSIGFYIAVVLLALVAPHVAVFGYLVIAVIAVFRQRGDSSPVPT
jgi:uncharacterized membrane protein